MKIRPLILAIAATLSFTASLHADLATLLRRPVIDTNTPLAEVQAFAEAHVPSMPKVRDAADWERQAGKLRERAFDEVIFRGEARDWRTAKTRVEWLDTIPGGEGYRIRKLLYEAIPGLWIPALLYVPDNVSDKVPVNLAVNGHDRNGKAADYKQIRCINMAKRGMYALNVEWVGMGQLATPGFMHYRMNQIDLCGTSGIAVHYLAMSRAIDILLALPNTDASRLSASGLSGGGWQTIFISGLDTRVTLSNPVAGYSSYKTRARFSTDLGDSEQTPSDLASVLDYTHLTAMLSSRSALLTFNAKDQCCFRADHALEPLLKAARPMFELHKRGDFLQWHVNHDPGTHNFEQDNREALYRMMGRVFYPGDSSFKTNEIVCTNEVKTAAQLDVPLPADNLDFSQIARRLSLIASTAPITSPVKARKQLAEIVRLPKDTLVAVQIGKDSDGPTKAIYWQFKFGTSWTVPATELVRGTPKGTVVVIADKGRASAKDEIEALLASGKRVIAVDPFYFGESRIVVRDFLHAMLVTCTGERPLGIQAHQVGSIAKWAGGAEIAAIGPRTGLIALVAGALDTRSVRGVELEGSWKSLVEVLEKDGSVDQMPEVFCFGLLKEFDIPRLEQLLTPGTLRRR
ncbi:MAG TPA: acetylxylan esterase [Roseimicrobium sp.]|nr:acetylxylan esterase [Roseimicrobium sp.]